MATDQKTRTGKPRVGRRRIQPDLSTYSGRFAARLRKLREAKNRTVPEMCELLESLGWPVPQSTYYGYESGEARISLDMLPYLAEALGRSVRSLMPEE